MNITHNLNLKYLLTILIAVLVHFEVYMQSNSILFNDISLKDLLANDRADSVHEDSEGFLWISNISGTLRYDGFDFKKYSLNGEDFRVRNFYSDSKQRLWAVSNIGLLLYYKNEDIFKRYELNNEINSVLAEGGVHGFLEDLEGNFWFSDSTDKLVRFLYNNNSVNIYNSPKGIINYVAELDRGNLVVSTSEGEIFLFRKRDEKFEKIHLGEQKINVRVTSIVVDQNKNIWIGTLGEGIYVYSYFDKTTKHFDASKQDNYKSVNNNKIITLLADHNNIWIGTDGGGLNFYDYKENLFFYFISDGPKKYNITDNTITSICKGKNDVMWLGTVHGGISYFKNNLFNQNIPLETFSVNKAESQTWRILEDSSGNLWLGVGRDGLRKYNLNTHELSIYRNDPMDSNSPCGNIIISLYEDRKGKIWIGTYYGGVCLFDPVRNSFKNLKESNIPWAIEEGPNGNIWVGTNKGIMVYDLKGNFIKPILNFDNSINPTMIKVLKKDIQGNMWIGTSTGLYMQNTETGKFEKFNTFGDNSETLSYDIVTSIFEDSDLSIWVGTFKSGLNLFDRKTKKFKRIGKHLELKGDQIIEIWEDKNKNIWASTNNGFSRINPNGEIANFGLKDGIYPASPGHVLMSKSGKVIQGNMYGLNFYDLSKLKIDNIKPSMTFTDIEIIEKATKKSIQVPVLEKTANNIPYIELMPRTPNITINFLAFNYLSPNDNQYMYKVEGLDGGWHNIGNQRNVSFSFLPAGIYTLWVKGANSYGVWSEKGIQLKIRVLPTFFEKKPIQFLTVFLFIIITVLIYRWRLHSIKQQRQKLKNKVAEQTEELVKKQAEVLEQNKKLLESEQLNHQLKEKQLNDELSFKVSELTNNTLRSIHKNKLLTDIKKTLSYESKQKVANKENLKLLLSEINDTLKLDSNWEDFYTLFNQLNSSFISNLKQCNPDLTEHNIKMCALLKLGFKSGEIATLFGVSDNSIKVSRYRLRQKLGLNSDMSFDDFFKRLEND